MGRLIDVDDIFTNGVFAVDAQNPMKCITELLNRISNAPTAYDVEKVVDHVRQDCYSMGFDESQTEIVVADIRKGGVE